MWYVVIIGGLLEHDVPFSVSLTTHAHIHREITSDVPSTRDGRYLQKQISIIFFDTLSQ